MIGSILTSDKEPSGVLDDGLPLKYAHKGDDWDTGGLFWDAKYGQERTKTLQAEDLVLRDLGYHDSGDLENIAQCKSYYISRIRWNTQVYQKEEDGNWILLNIESLTKNLDEGETLELPEVYIGFKHKHRTRLILYRLKQNEWGKRLKHHKKMKKQKPRSVSKVNLLVTNTLPEKLPATEVYAFYSLR